MGAGWEAAVIGFVERIRDEFAFEDDPEIAAYDDLMRACDVAVGVFEARQRMKAAVVEQQGRPG